MLLAHLVNFLHAWQRYNATVRQLSMLTDLELAAIGLNRSQISSVACRSAWVPASGPDAERDARIGHADR